jgi:hypothetical protein
MTKDVLLSIKGIQVESSEEDIENYHGRRIQS